MSWRVPFWLARSHGFLSLSHRSSVLASPGNLLDKQIWRTPSPDLLNQKFQGWAQQWMLSLTLQIILMHARFGNPGYIERWGKAVIKERGRLKPLWEEQTLCVPHHTWSASGRWPRDAAYSTSSLCTIPVLLCVTNLKSWNANMKKKFIKTIALIIKVSWYFWLVEDKLL